MTLDHILQYWPIATVAAGLIAGWVKLTSRLTDVEDRLTRSETKVDSVSPVLISLQVDMSSVKTSLEFIKAEIAKKQYGK